jgi:hypothetical protein
MDAPDLDWLRSAEGSVAAAEAAAMLASGTELNVLRRLGHSLSSSRARAAVSLALGRRTAAGKFEDAHRLFCDREAAEQASHEAVSMHLAARFAGLGTVADLGCGMGGDALALAHHCHVLAIDRDPVRLAMLSANAEVRGLASRVTPLAADLLRWSAAPDIEAIWADPARRDGSGRRLRPEAWSPPMSRIHDLASQVGAAGIKLAPGIDTALLPADAEVEFISLDREMKAAVLWTGRLARVRRTASVLPSRESITSADAQPRLELRAPGRYLYDPDPTVGRAGLVETLGAMLGAWQLDERIAYLTSDHAEDSPFARRFEVHAWLPFSERGLLEVLHKLGASRVDVTRRGSPVDTNALERRLNAALRSGATARTCTVALTRSRGQHIAIVCTREPVHSDRGACSGLDAEEFIPEAAAQGVDAPSSER